MDFRPVLMLGLPSALMDPVASLFNIGFLYCPTLYLQPWNAAQKEWELSVQQQSFAFVDIISGLCIHRGHETAYFQSSMSLWLWLSCAQYHNVDKVLLLTMTKYSCRPFRPPCTDWWNNESYLQTFMMRQLWPIGNLGTVWILVANETNTCPLYGGGVGWGTFEKKLNSYKCHFSYKIHTNCTYKFHCNFIQTTYRIQTSYILNTTYKSHTNINSIPVSYQKHTKGPYMSFVFRLG